MKLDPNTGISTVMGSELGSLVNKWHGGAVGLDGRIYCAPANAVS
jgi:hypothetical protein